METRWLKFGRWYISLEFCWIKTIVFLSNFIEIYSYSASHNKAEHFFSILIWITIMFIHMIPNIMNKPCLSEGLFPYNLNSLKILICCSSILDNYIPIIFVQNKMHRCHAICKTYVAITYCDLHGSKMKCSSNLNHDGKIASEIGSWSLSVSFNTLWPSDVIWWHRSGFTLAKVMACCLMAQSHYINQCWLLISEVQWHSNGGTPTTDTSTINLWNELENYLCAILFKSPRIGELNYDVYPQLLQWLVNKIEWNRSLHQPIDIKINDGDPWLPLVLWLSPALARR